MTTAGQKLKARRLEKNLSLEDVSKQTKIKPIFLEYIENGDYQKLPSVSYAHGFVRNYALFLGLNEKEIIAIFKREFDYDKSIKVLPRGFESEREFRNSKFKIRSSALLIIVTFILFFGFIAFQYRSAFLNPSLTISTPKTNDLIYSSQVTIQGKTDPNVTVYVERNEVHVDSDGNFTKTVNVFPGDVAINIRAINKFQRETDKTIIVRVKGQ